MPPRPASIKVRALQWLAQREHSRIELRDKLLRLLTQQARHRDVDAQALCLALPDGNAGPDPAAQAAPAPDPTAEVEALLQWLETRGYLSQQRFVESRVHARQSRFGNLRIQHELKQHGLGLDAEAQQGLRQTELRRAQDVWRKKYGTAATDAAGRVRQMRFLAGRGFSLDIVRRVVQGGGRSDDLADDAPDGDMVSG